MGVYDHQFSNLSLDGYPITDWADATDALQINPVSEKGTFVEGINRGVFVASNKKAVQLVINLLQNSPDTAFLNGLLQAQDNLKSYEPIQGYYRDTVNGDTIMLINGWFAPVPNYVRGNGHNNMTWTIIFEKETRILTGGK